MIDSKFESDSSVRRILKNGIYVAARFVLYTLSGIVFIPYLVRKFGTGTYGLIALAGFLTQYVGLISTCVGNAIARFLNISLNQHDWKEANQIFSTALVSNFVLILIECPFFALGLWKLDLLIDFPAAIGAEFRFLVACNIAVFFIAMMTGVMRTPIQASNRLDIISKLDMIRLALRLVVLVLLIEVVGAKLWLIGVVDLCLATANAAAIMVVYRRLARHLKFSWKQVTRKWIRPVINLAGWSIVTALGGFLLVKTDVWLINRFVDANMAGVYAALLVWPNFLKQVSKQLATVLEPVYLIDYAKGDRSRVARVSLSSAKLLGCLVALGSGILYVSAGPLLTFWLGQDATEYVMLFRIMVFYLSFTIGEAVLWQIYLTLNKVHYTGIISLCAGMLNILLSLTLIRAGYGAIGVAVSTAVSLFLASGLAIPLGVCREFKTSYTLVWKNLFYALLLLLFSIAATATGFYLLKLSVVYAVLAVTAIFTTGLYMAYRTILNEEERFLIRRVISIVTRRFPGGV